MILSVYIIKPNSNCAYSVEDSSIIFGDDRRKRTIGFIVLATRSFFLILLSVRTLRPGLDHSYLGGNSSVFSKKAGEMSESRLFDIDIIESMRKDW